MAAYRWFVAQALAGLEATAIYYLTRAGITAFSPTIRIDDKRGAAAARLFPGYVFVELAGGAEAGVVNRTRGIHKVLPIHASSPLALPVGFVEGLQERLSGGFDEDAAESLLRKFLPGEEVTILLGPFADHRGTFLRYHKGAGEILCALLGREIALKVPLHQLSSAENYHRRGARRVGQVAVAA